MARGVEMKMNSSPRPQDRTVVEPAELYLRGQRTQIQEFLKMAISL